MFFEIFRREVGASIFFIDGDAETAVSLYSLKLYNVCVEDGALKLGASYEK